MTKLEQAKANLEKGAVSREEHELLCKGWHCPECGNSNCWVWPAILVLIGFDLGILVLAIITGRVW